MEKKNSLKKVAAIVIIVIMIAVTFTGGFMISSLHKEKPSENKNNNVVRPSNIPSIEPDNDTLDDDKWEEYDRLLEEFDEEKYCKDEEKNPIYEDSKDNLVDLDLAFLKLENNKDNKIYSPLSIKYALSMLNDGLAGTSKKQVSDILKDTILPKYTNNNNMSFANALFVKKSFSNAILPSYIENLKNNYNAEMVYDNDSDKINNWISQKTFNLINNVVDSDFDSDFLLVNALAIDMKWKKRIQPFCFEESFGIGFLNEDFSYYIPSIQRGDYSELSFDGKDVRGLSFAAIINKYDIVKTLGEDNIRKTVTDAFREYANRHYEDSCAPSEYFENTSSIDEAVKKYAKSEELNNYIKDLDSNYKKYDKSTDFYFYDDNDVTMFAKDLKRYNGVELQYVGIMPKRVDLKSFINSINADKINNYTSNLMQINLENFDDGYIYVVKGTIPEFEFEYKLNFIDDLNKLGITDAFDGGKADLSNMTTATEEFISDAVHAAKISFTDFGITAGAMTFESGDGDDTDACPFEYYFDVPIKKIDLTFNKPFMFIIRDKDNGETWFVGTVYDLPYYKSVFVPYPD